MVNRLKAKRRLVSSGASVAERFGQELPEESPRDNVGEVLRRARESYGQDLESVAEALRIRHVHLRSIEDGRYADLPGVAYAVGFVRTYADYLRLDRDEIVRRFKHEVAGQDEAVQLVFPTPVPEGKVPGGAIVLISVLLVAVIYGVWFYLSNQGTQIADLIPDVPERLQSLLDPDVTKVEPAAETQAAPAPEPATELAVPLPEALAAVPESAVPEVVQPEAVVPATASTSVDPAAAPAAESPGPASEPELLAALAPPDSVPESPPGSPESMTSESVELPGESPPVAAVAPQAPEAPEVAPSPAALAEPEVKLVGTSAAAAVAPIAPPIAENGIPEAPTALASLSAGEGRTPRVYGEDNAGSRITLRATLDSWVQVRDGEGDLLLTRVLRPGDSYRVPDQPGLTLVTGNAGGLQVEVDGTAIAPIGKVGMVRRNFALDPQRLVAGTARP